MSDESRPFKGPYRVVEEDFWAYLWDSETTDQPIHAAPLEANGRAECEQLRLALELLELLPEIERALYTTEGRPEIVSKLAALKEPRP